MSYKRIKVNVQRRRYRAFLNIDDNRLGYITFYSKHKINTKENIDDALKILKHRGKKYKTSKIISIIQYRFEDSLALVKILNEAEHIVSRKEEQLLKDVRS